jgi:uncharacterized membrane protein YbhN (UPF0104 family)
VGDAIRDGPVPGDAAALRLLSARDRLRGVREAGGVSARASIPWRIARLVFGTAGLAFLVVAFVHALTRPQGAAFPEWRQLIAAGVLSLVTLALSARGWTSLFDAEEARPALARGFFVAQLAKYIPGAVWQVVALVDSARRAGAGRARASAAFPTYAVTQVAAGATVGAIYAFAGSGRSPLVRLAAFAGLASVVLLDRRWMARAVAFVARRAGRENPVDAIPPQRAILECYAWSLGAMAGVAIAFAVLLSSLHTGASGARAFAAFALAWTAGFIALPFPSGVGIREAVLLGALAPVASAPIIAASVAQRLVNMIAEVVSVGAAALLTRGGAQPR